MKATITIITVLLATVFSRQTLAQEYTFDDFIGTWHGYISSESFGGYYDQMTMIIEADGFYTESSGHLMPTIYPNTQECEFDAETNRMHWWYLKTVYAGQYFYQHFFYEIVYFNNDTLEMHYNFWDDPEPHPQVGTIFIVRENLTPPPVNFEAQFQNEDIMLSWNAPAELPNGVELLGYNIYYKFDGEMFEQIDFVEETSYTHMGDFQPGIHTYYLTALYNTGVSDPSGEVEVEVLLTAIEDIVEINTVVYPNPATDAVYIRSEFDVNNIKLYNNTGQLLSISNVNSKNHQLNVNDLPSGLFFVIVETSAGTITKKIFVQ